MPELTIFRDDDYRPRDLRRKALEIRDLAQKLKCPPDLFRVYRQERLIHEMRAGERLSGLGFTPEEMSAFVILSHCHNVHDMPLRGCHSLLRQITTDVSNTFPPRRVFFCLKTRSARTEGCIICSEAAEIEVQPGEIIEVFDLTQLCDAVDVAFGEEPLKLPSAASVQIPESDPRVVRVRGRSRTPESRQPKPPATRGDQEP